MNTGFLKTHITGDIHDNAQRSITTPQRMHWHMSPVEWIFQMQTLHFLSLHYGRFWPRRHDGLFTGTC